MKSLLFVFFFTIITGTALAASSAVLLDVPAEAKARYVEAEALRAKEQFALSYPIYAELLQKHPSSFTVNYGYGLLLAQMKRFPESAETLKTALNLGKAKERMPDPSIWNTLGWVSIMSGNLDQALECFKTAKENPETYASLSDETKMKLHNNAGYALMLMDRYEEAKKEFYKAEQLGSEKAKLNIEKIDSLIETQKKQDPDIPGVFAVVVFSIRNKDGIDKAVLTQFERLHTAVPELDLKSAEEINVYLAKNGIYLLALGSNYSYAKAQVMLGNIKKTVPDAFVSSTTNWEPFRVGGQQPSAANAAPELQ
jgi:tetratricopeptide (TPR) repeat protein